MLKKIVVIGLLTFGAMGVALAAEGVQGAVGNIDSATNALVAGTVGCRYYSVSGSDAGINNNVPSCTNQRCIRPYATAVKFSPGGYLCQGENTVAYNADANNQTFYMLVDAQANAGTGNHVGFFSIAGQTASSAGIVNLGDPGSADCGGTITSTNCFTRADSNKALATPLVSTYAQFGANAHQIAPAGGLSPIPTVRVGSIGSGCPAGQVRLTWDDPFSYASLMKNGVQSPVLGVKLYKNANTCATPPSGDVAGWVALNSYPMGAGTTGICEAITQDTWFALTVRVKGPTSSATELETGIQGAAGFVGANSQCVAASPTAVRIAGMSARYAGRGTVEVKFQTGAESGVTGYYVQRAKSATGPWTRVSEMVAPMGDGTSYTVSDKVKSGLGHVLYYSVEVVNNDGTTTNSGSSAVSIPQSQRKLSPGN